MKAPKVTSSRAERRLGPSTALRRAGAGAIDSRRAEQPPPSPRLRHAARGALAALAALAVLLPVLSSVACGGQRTSDGSIANQAPRDPAAAPDNRTEIERRRDAACDQVGPKLTSCAVEDARAMLNAGKITRAQFDDVTAPALLRKHTDEYLKGCKSSTYSSRQVRVLEVCFRDAPACSDLLDCLDNLHKPANNP
jgi:hypothetical protein